MTHFCAPVVVFLAGTSAFLHGRKLDTGSFARFLVTRGLLLVVLELTLIRFTWTFNLDYAGFTLAGVIWMLGWCMVLLAALVRFTPRTVGVIGIAIMAFQQLFTPIGNALPSALGTAWRFLYPVAAPSPEWINILYVIVPWVGVMAAGYGFGALMQRESAERRRLCLRVGLGATALWIAAGGALVLTQSPGEHAPPAFFRLLNQGKYPPTQLFLLMMLGPAIALIPWAETARGWFVDALATFGRVPMFYYLPHIPIIHASGAGREPPARRSHASGVVPHRPVRAAGAGTAVEPRAALSRVRDLRGAALSGVPLVRLAQGHATCALDAVHLDGARVPGRVAAHSARSSGARRHDSPTASSRATAACPACSLSARRSRRTRAGIGPASA